MKFSRRSETKTIAPFVMTSQRQTIPGKRDIFLDLLSGGFRAAYQFFKAIGFSL